MADSKSEILQGTLDLMVLMAMGATRSRIVRQLLIESLVLGALGGAIGVILAIGGVRLFEAAMLDSQKPYWLVFTADRAVVGYVAGLCVLTALLFGLAPALHVSKTSAADVLKEGGRGISGTRRVRWFSSTLIVVELALTIVLLAGAGFMGLHCPRSASTP